MCIAGKMLAWRPVLYIIHTVYDPGGLYAPQAANHIKIMHLRIVGNHSQHGQHNRFTLVQRKRQSPPDSQPEVLTYTHVFKGVWTLLSLLLLLLVCSSITTAPLLTITANWQKWILQLGDKSEAWTGMSAQGLISSSLSDPAEYWAMRCQINFLSLAGSWVWLPSKLPRVKR